MRIRSVKPELLDSAIAGFFLGEGHLDLVMSGRGTLLLRARIALRADDADMLVEIQSRFGGSIHARPSTRSHCWTISGCARVGALLDALEECPLPSKKRAEVELMREAQTLVSRRGIHIAPSAKARLFAIRDELKAARRFKCESGQ